MKFSTLLVLAVFFIGASGVQAQDCSSYKKAHCSKYAKKYCSSSAMTVALLDENIISTKDALTGATKYMRKVECPSTGTMSYQAVRFDHSSKTFVCDKACDLSKCKDMKNCRIKQCIKGGALTAASVQTKRLRT